MCDVRAYGAQGDGQADDRAAFARAATAAPLVVVPAGDYLFGGPWVVPPGTRIVGAGAACARILHGFAGDLWTLGDGVVLEHLSLLGQGAAFPGGSLLVPGSWGRQKLLHCTVVDFDGYCLDFRPYAGSLFFCMDCELWQTHGERPGRHAVRIAPDRQLEAKPRTFLGVQTGGKKFIQLGGCNNVFVGASFVGELAYTSDSRAVLVTGSRVGVNEAEMVVDGHGNTITGCDVGPLLTLAPGCDNCVVGPNTYNRQPGVVDRSGNTRNLVYSLAQP